MKCQVAAEKHKEFRLVLYVTKGEITARSQCQHQAAAVEQRPDSKNKTRMKWRGENKHLPSTLPGTSSALKEYTW